MIGKAKISRGSDQSTRLLKAKQAAADKSGKSFGGAMAKIAGARQARKATRIG
jgi:hypothetical protein